MQRQLEFEVDGIKNLPVVDRQAHVLEQEFESDFLNWTLRHERKIARAKRLTYR